MNADLEYWLGIKWNAAKDTLTWSDGEAVDFADWMSGEPNLSGECVRISKLDKWRDHPCTMIYNFVCKKKGIHLHSRGSFLYPTLLNYFCLNHGD